ESGQESAEGHEEVHQSTTEGAAQNGKERPQEHTLSEKKFLKPRRKRGVSGSVLRDPTSTHHDIPVVEHCGLSGSDCALGLVKGDQYLVVGNLLEQRGGRLVTMADLHRDAQGLAQLTRRDQ